MTPDAPQGTSDDAASPAGAPAPPGYGALVGTVVGATLSSLVAWKLVTGLRAAIPVGRLPRQPYDDFVASAVALTNYRKYLDMWTIVGTLIVAALLLVGLRRAVRDRTRATGAVLDRVLASCDALGLLPRLVIVALVPAAYNQLARPSWGEVAGNLGLSVALLAGLAAAAFLWSPRGAHADASERPLALQGALWTGGLAFAAFLATAVFLRRRLLSPSFESWSPSSVLLGAGLIAVVASAALLLVGAGRSQGKGWAGVLLLLQVPLPLLYWAALPPPWRQGDRLVEGYGHSWLLTAALLAATLAALWALARRARRLWSAPANEVAGLDEALEPLALAAVAFFIAMPMLGVPRLTVDDFHNGEQLYPWMQWTRFGRIPFVDFMPPHGLYDALAGLLGVAFYDGTAAGSLAGDALLRGCFGAALFLALRRLTHLPAALLVGGLLPGVCDSRVLCFLLPAALLANPDLLARGRTWLAVWVVSSAAVAFVSTSFGVFFCLASLPFALVFAWRELRRDRSGFLFASGLLGATGLLVALLTPLGRMFLGALRFLLEGSRVNQVAYGLPWTSSRATGVEEALRGTLLSHPLILDAFRLLWVPMVVLGGSLVLRELRARRAAERAEGVWLLSLLPLGLVAAIPYTFGRIGAMTLSRPGMSTNLGLALLAVALFAAARRTSRFVPLLAAVALVLLTALPWPPDLRAQTLLQRASAIIAPAGQDLAVDPELPGLGRTKFVVQQHAQELDRLSEVARFLGPNDSFLDFSNRTALYFLLDRPMRWEWGALYTAVDHATEARMLEALAAERPPLVVVGFQNIVLDGVSSCLRSYRICSWLLDRDDYALRTVGPLAVLVRRDKLPAFAALGLDDPLTTDPFTDPNWDNGVGRFANPASFIVQWPRQVRALKVGDVLVFARSGPRRILAIQGRKVDVEGPRLDPVGDGYPRPISTGSRGPAAGTELDYDARMDVLDRYLGQIELADLPSAWGESWDHLGPLTRKVASFTLPTRKTSLHNFEEVAPGAYRPTAPDPWAFVDLGRAGAFAGRNVSVIGVNVKCVGRHGQPRMELFWQSERDVMSEKTVVRFNIGEGLHLVPVGHNPRWRLGGVIEALRFDLQDHGTCDRLEIGEVDLLYRVR